MKNNLFILLFFVCVSHLSAQEERKEIAFPDNFIAIGVSFYNIIEPITPTLELGAEYRFMGRFSLEGKYGFQVIPAGWGTRSNKLNDKFKEFRSGFKFLIPKNNRRFQFYIGLEYLGLRQNYTRENDSFFEGGTRYSYSSSKITRKVNAMRLMYGWQVFLGKKNRWFIEKYFGLGVRNVNLAHNPENLRPNTNELIDEWTVFRNSHRYPGVKNKIDIAFGMRFCFIIKSWE